MSARPRVRMDEAEQALIRELYPPLRRFAAIVGPSDVEPDDLVQEAMMRVLRKRPLGDLEFPNAYLRRTIYNLASDQRRSLSRSRRAMSRLGSPEPHFDIHPSDLDDLEVLSPKGRAVLYLHEIEGRPFAEIAELLGERESSLRRAATRARRRLAGAFAEEERNATA